MVVRTPNVNQPVVAPPQLIEMVRDVRGQIGVVTILLANHAVFFILKFRRPKPRCLVTCKYQVTLFKVLQSRLDFPRGKQRRLAVPRLELHPESLKIIFDGSYELVGCPLPAFPASSVPVQVQKILALFPIQRLRQDFDVVSMVTVLGKRKLTAVQFQIPCVYRVGQQFHLATRVIDIIFLVDFIPCGSQ